MATKKTPAKKPAKKKPAAKEPAAKKPVAKKAAAKKPVRKVAPKKVAAKKPAPKKAAPKPAPQPAPQPTPQPAPQAAPQENGAGTQQGPMLRILAQYIKDVSFENPLAPDSLRSDQDTPAISINIEIGRQYIDENTVEVVLMLGARADRDGKTVFLCELEYAGLFAFGGMPEEHVQPMILIECPRLLFPFARQIMASLTQNGGYPPILLEPPDFAGMFRDEMMRRAQQEAGPEGASNAGSGVTFN